MPAMVYIGFFQQYRYEEEKKIPSLHARGGVLT